MIPFVATYRLQFRGGMTFDKAAEIVPYLKQLGISHLYASPVFTAVAGSTHGYDVTDHNEIDPAIGGAGGFERLGEALRRQGMGLILDIVPNHMAASLENRWWRSVVEHGAASPFARHFDIDWSEKLTLPILGRDYKDVLADGEFAIEADAEEGCLTLTYFDHRLPLFPPTYGMVAERLDGDEAAGRLAEIGNCRDARERHANARALLAGQRGRLAPRLENLSRDKVFLDRLHDAQPWRLMFWKNARRHLTYRRFFEVAGLVGVRVEADDVFDDVHRLTLSLLRSGNIDGLRIDHVDGLALPTSYLHRLRQEVGPEIPIFVEKILAGGERLPPGWPVRGSTGYEFIPAMADLLVDQAGARRLEQSYDDFIGRQVDVKADLRQAKLLILRRNFEGELRMLAALAAEMAEAAGTRFELNEIEDAIAEIIIGFEVYRTYGEIGPLASADREVLQSAVETAVTELGTGAPSIEFVAALIRGNEEPSEKDTAFRIRFQQLTGPVMAKAVEDTLYYRHNPLIALNEVGCSPGVPTARVDRFHKTMQAWAHGPPRLLATATHDTKRGEDARTRLYALAEQPSLWNDAVVRWSRMNAGLRRNANGRVLPDLTTEWLIYQALAGVWPWTALRGAGHEPDLAPLAGRFLPYIQKALREAKLHTDWLNIDEAYESAVLSFVEDLLESTNFLSDFSETLHPFIQAGMINTASQTLAKLTAPGTPDIYQGSEGLDLSLVDPDNRRPVDFSRLEAQLASTFELTFSDFNWTDDAFKQWMIGRCLASRAANLKLFTEGAYVQVPVEGEQAKHVVAYLREYRGQAALIVLQRLPLQRAPMAGTFGDAVLNLPRRWAGIPFRDVLTGRTWNGAAELPVDVVLGPHAVALALIAR